MKLSTALLFLPLTHAGKESIDLSGSSTESTCLNSIYQQTHPDSTLQCQSLHRFWTKISAVAPSQCVEGRYLHIKELSFTSLFSWDAYDFSIYFSTGSGFGADTPLEYQNPYLLPLYGEECAVHSLSGTEGTDVDGDICYDVVAEKVDISTIITVPELTIPCSGSEGTVQLQFCSSWRSEEENEDCRVNGASPCSFDGCACEMVDLGVEIVSPENAKPTCEPTQIELTDAPTPVEAPTAPNGKPAFVTPAPSPGSDAPTPAPFVISVTSSPISMDTPSPTGLALTDDVTSDTITQASTCKNNAVITPIDIDGSLEITTSAAHGACAIYSTNIIYYPLPNYLGRDECSYTSCSGSDESGELECSEGLLEVNVVECSIDTPVPTASSTDVPTVSPTCDYATINASNNEVTTSINTSIDIQVLENDIALDGLPLDVIAILFPGNNGVCTIANEGETITYTPNQDYFGNDKCIYTACDEKGHCDSATVVIVVTPSSEEVVTNDDDITTNMTTPVDVFALENDIQVDGHDLAITQIVENALSGDCVIVNQGSVVMYIPEPDFTGVDSCVYEACDDRGVCDTATITVTVDGSPCGDKATPEPTPNPTPKPTAPTFVWVPTSASPTAKPTSEPSSKPTLAPSNKPTANPTLAPSNKPTANPTPAPTPEPTSSPTLAPSDKPTANPTLAPSDKPTANPTLAPTDEPTPKPTPLPTDKPVLTWTFATRKPTGKPVTPSPIESPTSPAPTPCGDQVFFLKDNICTNEVFIAGQFFYETVVSCCDTNFGSGSYMDGSCDFVDACSTPVPSPSPVESTGSPNCAPGPFSPIDIEGKLPTPEPTPFPTLAPVSPAPTTCEDRPFFFYENSCTNMVYSADAASYSSASSCCDANVALGSLSNGRCKYIDVCIYAKPTPFPSTFSVPKDTLPPTIISIPEDTPAPTPDITVIPNGASKTLPPTPAPSEISTELPTPSPFNIITDSPTDFSIFKTYAPSPIPTYVEVPTTPAPTFGSTPTVGTSATLAPVRERGD